MSFIAKTLRSDRFKMITDAQNLINGENVTDETFSTFDAMIADADALMKKIERVEKVAAEANRVDEIIGASAEKSKVSFDEKLNEVDLYKACIVAQLRQGAKVALTPKDKTALEDFQNAASLTGSAGGFTVPTDLMREIFAAMILEGGVREVARIITTSQGNPIDMPMNDDTANVAVQVAENTSLGTGTDLVFSKITLGAYKWTSQVQLISKELLQDSAFSFDEFLMQQLVHRFVRGTNAAYTVGNGTTNCQGVVTGASLGTTGTTGQTTTVIYNDLVNLEHSVAVPYRRNATFMLSDAMFKTIKRLQDTLGRPIWLPNITVGAPDSILGYPISINADLAVPAANAKSILFGDFKQFIIRDVLDLNFTVLNELYAATGQVGFVGLMRTDSKVASVGACLKWYANSAT